MKRPLSLDPNRGRRPDRGLNVVQPSAAQVRPILSIFSSG